MALIVNNQDISEIAGSVKHETSWNDGPGKLTFDYPSWNGRRYPNGCPVTFQYGKDNIFYGWLFSTKQNGKKYSCTCWDQLRYFKGSNSLMRPKGTTLSAWVNTVALDCGNRIRLGAIENTQYPLGKYLFDNKTRLDMIYQSIEDNLIGNGYWYVLRDNFGVLELRDVYNLRLPIIVGTGSLGKDFEYEKSIDDDTYNYVKVAKDDSKKGVRNVYVSQDSKTMSQWGKLMIYDKVSADLNDVQLASRANRLLSVKDRETEKLSVECMGNDRIFAGNSVRVVISEAGIDKWAVVDKCTHEFKKDSHTMKLDLIFSGITSKAS